jgi:hypothetical protein
VLAPVDGVATGLRQARIESPDARAAPVHIVLILM